MFEAGQGRLKVVGRAGVGIDNVDLQAATEVSLLPYRGFYHRCMQVLIGSELVPVYASVP